MPNIVKVLKQEISRIARKEAKAAVAPLRKPHGRARIDIAGLKRRVALLEQANKQLQDRLAQCGDAPAVAVATEPSGKGWISGKGVRSLRKRLGLLQAEFATLVGVSTQAVHTWESKPGLLRLRKAPKAAVLAARSLGAREARTRLAELVKTVVKGPRRKTRKPASKRK